MPITQHRPPRRLDLSAPPVLRVPREGWQSRGACVVPADAPVWAREALWSAFDEPHVGPNASPGERAARLAMLRGLCGSCPVLVECGELGAELRWGFVAGLTPEERVARRRGDGRSHEQLAEAAARAEQERRERRAREADWPVDGEVVAVLEGPTLQRPSARTARVFVRRDPARWRAVAARFGAIGSGGAVVPSMCCPASARRAGLDS